MIRSALGCALLSLGAGCGDPLGPDGEYAAAARTVEDWVQRHPAGWFVSIRAESAPSRPEWSQPCAADPPGGLTALRVGDGATNVLLFFRCPAAGQSESADLEARFSHAVLDELPHGISSPRWTFRIITPSSAVTEPVRLRQWEAGRMSLSVPTEMYAVYGHSTRDSCEPPADAPSPRGCTIIREHRVPLGVTVSFPWAGTELE